MITLRISASALKDFRLVWRGESEYCSGGSIDVRLEQLALTNVPLLLVFVLRDETSVGVIMILPPDNPLVT